MSRLCKWIEDTIDDGVYVCDKLKESKNALAIVVLWGILLVTVVPFLAEMVAISVVSRPFRWIYGVFSHEAADVPAVPGRDSPDQDADTNVPL